MTTNDLAKQERQKLELLRSVLTYFQYAAQETRPDVLRREIERINLAREETQSRLRTRHLEVTNHHPDQTRQLNETQHLDETTRLNLPWVGNSSASGRHHRNSN